MEVAWWAWVAVLVAIGAMLAVDLLMHRDDHAPSIREALMAAYVPAGQQTGFWLYRPAPS